MKLTYIIQSFLFITLSFKYAASSSVWILAYYNDIHETLKRYSHCIPNVKPLIDQNSKDPTVYLVSQITKYLYEADLSREQLTGLRMFMENICPEIPYSEYSVSKNINLVGLETSKDLRCKTLDDIMNILQEPFYKAALNKSEPLDLLTINLREDVGSEQVEYPLVDLINSVWIKSNIPEDIVCDIVKPVKKFTLLARNVSELTLASDRSGLSDSTSYMLSKFFVSIKVFFTKIAEKTFLKLLQLIFLAQNKMSAWVLTKIEQYCSPLDFHQVIE